MVFVVFLMSQQIVFGTTKVSATPRICQSSPDSPQWPVRAVRGQPAGSLITVGTGHSRKSRTDWGFADRLMEDRKFFVDDFKKNYKKIISIA